MLSGWPDGWIGRAAGSPAVGAGRRLAAMNTDGVWRSRFRRFGADVAHLLLSFPMALAAFVPTVVLFSLGAGTLIVWIGLPILLGALLTARGFAVLHRRAAAALGGPEAPDRPYLPAPEGSRLRRLLAPLRDAQSWLDLLWVLVNFPVSIVTWCLSLLWLGGAAGTVLGPIALFVLDRAGLQGSGLSELLGLPSSLFLDMLLNAGIGLVFLLTCMPVLRGLARMRLALGEAMLSTRARERARFERLSESRAAGRRAEAEALHRLERDIHDGPQQRLVRLRIDLARAKGQLKRDPEAVGLLLDEAAAQAQQTLAELRQLSRGIAPPVLVDRGLAAAVEEIAAASSVPVRVRAGRLGELPEHVQSAAYFVVAESLANLNKHAGASRAEVLLAREGARLRIEVHDDGAGGADPAKGHGLTGLAQRLDSVDGALRVDSPAGGPTRIEAVVSCAS